MPPPPFTARSATNRFFWTPSLTHSDKKKKNQPCIGKNSQDSIQKKIDIVLLNIVRISCSLCSLADIYQMGPVLYSDYDCRSGSSIK